MKKVFAALAAGVMASAMALSLAACAEPEEESLIDRAEEMVSERIASRETWEAAFADPTLGATDTSYTFNNANYSIEAETLITVSGNEPSGERIDLHNRTKTSLTVAGDKLRCSYRLERWGADASDLQLSEEKEQYYALGDGRYIRYSVENGSWIPSFATRLDLSLLSATGGETSLTWTSEHTGSLTSYAGSYESFTWSDERQGYTIPVRATLNEFLGLTVNATLTLKFREGKIAAMLISDAAIDPDAATDGLLLTDIAASVDTGVIVTYGGRTVTLPA